MKISTLEDLKDSPDSYSDDYFELNRIKTVTNKSDWYPCRFKPIPSCMGNNGFTVCGVSSTFSYFKTFKDYCAACIDVNVEYFALGICVDPRLLQLPKLKPYFLKQPSVVIVDTNSSKNNQGAVVSTNDSTAIVANRSTELKAK